MQSNLDSTRTQLTFAHPQIMASIENSIGDITHYIHGLSPAELAHIQDHLNILTEYIQHEMTEARAAQVSQTAQTAQTTQPTQVIRVASQPQQRALQTTGTTAGQGYYGSRRYSPRSYRSRGYDQRY